MKRHSGMWHAKRVLLSLMVIGGLGCFTITSAFALLSSETTNNRESIASGTLTFSNTVAAGTACFSYGAGSTGNVNSACDALFSSAALMYPGTAATVHVTITNNGSIDGSALSVYMPSCTAVTSPGAPSAGGGNPCGSGGLQVYIQETDSSFTPTSCVYPTTGGTCAFTANTMSYLSSVANTAASAWSLGAGPAHGASRYFIVGMELPSTAANNLQGEEALFDLTWHLTS